MRSMRIAVCLAAGCLAPGLLVAGMKTTSTWTAPEHTQRPYSKVMALAKITEEANRKVVEDEIVAAFVKQKMTAIPAYVHMKPEDLASPEAARKKALELGVDSALVVTVLEKGTQVKAGPSVSVGVGVPVHVGMFSVFVGGSVPVGGGPKQTQVFSVKADFYEKDSEKPIWSATYSGNLDYGIESAAKDLAKQSVKQLKKAKILK